jgi:outer membrane protein OmpA-like peptidoglycan-associated protein
LRTDVDSLDFFPYYYGGLGYEYVSGGRDEFDSSFYFQVGVGLDFGISNPSDDLHLVTEFRFIQLVGSDNGQDNEGTFFIGLKLPLGETLARYGYNESYYNPVEVAPFETYPEFSEGIKPSRIQTINTDEYRDGRISDGDGDGVSDSMDRCQNTPRNHAVDYFGCSIGDGDTYVEDSTPIVRETIPVESEFSTISLPQNRKVLNIHFELNSHQITADSRELIRQFVDSVNMSGYSDITVEGYTDSTGSFQSNVHLSQNRANSVRKLMIQYGIDSTMIKAVGKGAVNPLATNETAEGRAKNRRIELIVKPPKY